MLYVFIENYSDVKRHVEIRSVNSAILVEHELV